MSEFEEFKRDILASIEAKFAHMKDELVNLHVRINDLLRAEIAENEDRQIALDKLLEEGCDY